ncbi:MAG: LGFP repeat-containing protein [Dehalococcoidia bacterium]
MRRGLVVPLVVLLLTQLLLTDPPIGAQAVLAAGGIVTSTPSATPTAQSLPLGSNGDSWPSPVRTGPTPTPNILPTGTANQQPVITSVQFSGPGQNLQITVSGSGFGPAPTGLGLNADVANFQYSEGSGTQQWSAGFTGPNGNDAVTVNFGWWSDGGIQVNGFAGGYGEYNWSVQGGDPVSITITNSQTGQSATWTGTMPTSAGSPPSIPTPTPVPASAPIQPAQPPQSSAAAPASPPFTSPAQSTASSPPPAGFYLGPGILAEYNRMSGAVGPLGPATSSEFTASSSVFGTQGTVARFSNGSIYWSAQNGAHETFGAIGQAYEALGGSGGLLGYPRSDELVAAPSPQGTNDGRVQRFEGGSIYWSPATGAHEVNGAISQAYEELGGTTSALGFPTGDERDASKSPYGTSGRLSRFQGGSLYWSARYGAFAVWGQISAIFEQQHGTGGWLGFPTSPVAPDSSTNGNSQDFE